MLQSFPVLVLASLLVSAATMGAVLLARKRWMAVAAALAGATGLLLLQGLGYFDFANDDSYISLRYARHLADGLGPNWNSEGRVEGYTNFLWMATLAGVAKLGGDLVDSARAFGFLSLLATIVAVYLIWQLWADDDPESGVASPVVLAAALIGIALTDGVVFWGFSGMETPLFMALITGGAYCYLRERRGAGLVPWSAVVFAAAAMTRPEGVLAAAVTGAFVLGEALSGGDRRARARVLFWAAVFAALYGSYFLWRYSYYGYLFPNTFYAKTGTTNDLFNRGLEYVWFYGLRYQLLALAAGVSALLLRARLRVDAAYVLTLCGVLLAGVVYEGADSFPHGRFIAPLVPLLYLAGIAGGAVVLKRLALPARPAAVVATVLLTLAALSLARTSLHPGLAAEKQLQRDGIDLSVWLNENAPEDYTIGAYGVGVVGYYIDRDILDLLGLNDVKIAHTDVSNLGAGLAGHEKSNPDYVLEEAQPELIIPTLGDFVRRTEDQLREGFEGLADARRLLLADERLWERYDVRAVKIGNRWFHLLQRADTVSEWQAPGLF
ncbi:MAG: hypothetical protein WEE64_12760 [Dehalococcoidia bacterium]